MAVDFTPESSPGAFYQYTSPSSACFPSVLEPDLSFFSTHHQPNYPRSSLPDFGHLRGACSPHRPIPRNSRHHKHLATPTNNHNTPPRFTWDSLGPSTPPVDLTTSSPVEHSPRQSTDYLFESLSPEARFLEEACASCITPDAGTSHQRPPTMGRRRRSLSSQPRASSSQTPQSRPAKRRRTGESPSRCPGSSFDTHPPPEVESIDLTQVEDKSALADALSKQREDAVRAQMNNASGGDEAGRSSLTSYKCPVCMDVLENATSTICGRPLRLELVLSPTTTITLLTVVLFRSSLLP